MKQLLFLLPLTMLSTGFSATAQEGTADLSKKSRKGFMTEAVAAGSGYQVTYKMAGDKNKDDITYETYSFDGQLKFLNSEQEKVAKEKADTHPDDTVSGMGVYVGGCSSFDILSMKLHFTKRTLARTWNYARQAYVTKKVLTSESYKPKSENGKYEGYATFNSPDDKDLFVLAGVDGKEGKQKLTRFFVLTADASNDIKEKPADITGAQGLAFAGQLSGGDVVLVFAPNSGEGADIASYTYLRYSCAGELKSKVIFKSPSNNLLVVDVAEHDGSVFFCATSSKSDDAYNEVYKQYAGAIQNPCYPDGENHQDASWIKSAESKMAHFHLLKFTGDQFDFGTTADIAGFEDKLIKAPESRHADAYKGKKFSLQNFTVTPEGDYLIAGQLTGREKMGSSTSVKTYEDIVCLHFDKAGQLKAQYGVERLNDDKKSAMWPITQKFIPSKDGKSLYWQIMEVKGFKGYEGFLDAYYGVATFYPRYFPRIAKLVPKARTIAAFTALGGEDYYINRTTVPILNEQDNSAVFIGSDKSGEKLWLAKYVFQ